MTGSGAGRDGRRKSRGRASALTIAAAALAALCVFVLVPLRASGTGGGGVAAPAAPTGADLPDGAREIPSERTETARTWELPNGQQVTRSYAAPVNYRRDGKFERIDGDLVASPAAGFAYRNEGNAFRADLPADAAGDVRVAGSEEWVRFNLAGATKAAAKRAGDDVVAYGDALPGVDVAYQSVATGIKETLTLDGPRASRSYEYRVSMSDGLRPRRTEDGRIEFRRGDDVIFRFEAPYAADAAGAIASGEHAPSYELSERDGEVVVSLDIDADWLRAPQRRFPVTVDPTTTYVNGWAVMKGTTQETYIRSDTPDTRYDQMGYLRAGKDSDVPWRRHNALLKFDVASAVTAESMVLSADVGLYLQSKLNTEAAGLHIHELNKAWTTAATWNKADGTATWAGGSTGSFMSGSVVPTSGWTVWRDLKPLAERWVNGTTPNHGVMIDECCSTPLNSYDFVKSTGPADQIPYLQIRYEHRNGTYPGHSFWTPDQTVVQGEQPDLQGGRNMPPVAVNLGTGNLLLTETDREGDLSAPDNLPITRVHNSVWWGAWSHGRTWTNDFSGVDLSLQEQPDLSLSLRGPTNAILRFGRRSDGTYDKAEQADATVRLATNGEYIVTFAETGEQFIFPGRNRVLARHVDGAGRTTTWTYNTDAEGRAVDGTATDHAGRWTKWFFEYSAGHRRTDRIEAQDGKIYRYGYSTEDTLVSFTAPDGKITRYEYTPPYANTSNRWLTKVIRPDGSEIRFGYTGFNASRSIASYTTRAPGATVDGPTTRFAYSQLTPTTGKTTVTAPDGKVSEYFWNNARVITSTLSGASPPAAATLGGTLTSSATLNEGTTYPLTISAPAGTRSIEVLVDDEQEDFVEHACTTCTLSRTWTMDPLEFPAGAREVSIVLTSFSGGARTQTLRPVVGGSTANTAPDLENEWEEGPDGQSELNLGDPMPLFADNALVEAAKQGGTSAGTSQQTAVTTQTNVFNGLNFEGTNSTWVPPDPVSAVGPSDYVQMINGRVALYGRGLGTPTATSTLNAFGRGRDVYDPYVVWDQTSRRFFYAAAATADGTRAGANARHYVVFGWSKTADPSNLTTSWCRLRMRPANWSTVQDDYPKLGVSRNHIVIGTNPFQTRTGTEERRNSRLLVIAKPRNGDTGCGERNRRLRRFNNLSAPVTPGSTTIGTAPVVTPTPVNNTSTTHRGGYVLSSDFRNVNGAAGGSRLFVWRVIGTRSKPRLRSRTARVINVGEWTAPPNVPQNDSRPIHTLDGRLWQAVGVTNADNGQYQIWTQHTITAPPTADPAAPRRSAARWYQVTPPGTNPGAPLQSGTVDSAQVEGQGTNTFVFNGAVSPDRTGRVAAIHYNIARADLAVQIHARSRRNTVDPAGSMLGSQTILRISRAEPGGGYVSLNPNGCGTRPAVCRWGDYASAVPDPTQDGVIWGTNLWVGPDRTYRTQNFALSPGPRP